MICRAATVGNAAFISRVIVTSWRDAYRDFLPWSFLATLDENPHHTPKSWKDRIAEPSSVARIISSKISDAVGMLRMTIGTASVPETDSQLTALYLLSQARERGLGSEVLACARAEASRRGARALGLCVLERNKGGQHFYERHGARSIGRRVAFSLDREPIFDILYRFS
jgi:ribosomal protein S18 acetylase RimI-like enzyme